MRDSLIMFGAVILTALARTLILSHGERSGKEGLSQTIAMLVLTLGLLLGMLTSSHQAYRLREERIQATTQQQGGAESTQQSRDAISEPAEPLSCATIALMMGLLTAVLTVFNKSHNTVYKKAKYSLSKPVTTGKLIASPPRVRLSEITKIYSPPSDKRRNSDDDYF